MRIAISTEDCTDEDIKMYKDYEKAYKDVGEPYVMRPTRRAKLSPGQCPYCDRERDNAFHPPHDASHRCESGKHSHCSCDVCF